MTAQFTAVETRVTKTEGTGSNKKRVFFSMVPWNQPTLDSISDSLPAPDSWKEEKTEEGHSFSVPIYEDSILDFVQGAVTSRAFGIAKTRFLSDNDVPVDWSTLLESTGGSTFMTQKKVWKEGYSTFLESQSFSEKKQRPYLKYIDSKMILVLSDDKKAGVVQMLNAYEESMDEQEKAEVSSVLKSFSNALAVQAEEEEF